MAPVREGVIFCTDTMACMNLPGYTCKGGRCVCEPQRDTGLFSCFGGSQYGERCRFDEDCGYHDEVLVCSRADSRTCRCPRGLVWDDHSRKCYAVGDTYGSKFDAVRDLIIPGIIVMTIGAMVYLGIKLFCNCGKLWRRRRRRPDLSHELDDSHQQATWVASYRVFSPLSNGESRPSPVLSPSSSFPLHPAPCMGLFLPAGSLPGPGAPAAPAAGGAPSPPSYEESLKHKVILSSYPLTVVLPPAGTPGSVGAALAPIPAVPTPAPSPGTPGD
ncbi:uncharacterized protein LOC126259842 [Schistocerca nitens]|uniref:uncharacterized protein LOC126259842 n=1 Tax=Schistocerca nitens TaxID=7011 RepID=UPI0021186DDE|nr:uncharacterized protein LOC126259842 [Schistocerca nitens]